MRLLSKILLTFTLTLTATLFISSAYAGSDAGRGSAKYYKTFPDKWDGKKVHMDCVSVKRINGGPQVEGVVFFGAQTIDDKNNAPGGSIVVAVLEGDVEAFVRKYGTVMERTPGGSERVDNTRLSGVFHQLERGHVYLDASGEANDLILGHKEEAKNAIRFGDGIRSGGGDGKGGPYMKRKYKK
ncbi:MULTISPECIES: hypothetical protein [unclassified Lentimonas]|uniref:hypothetical protein n=1 Tax=unclassified Lentimonas TaxID=2630993 RepID=UPI00132240B4|nr:MULTISPECIES: hypothetical protein [unclassified Lentimonas]CAA6678760.1 Unannotated [Lentimonas sp. CC4]CAA6683746.1 Unannotated [Lentimonas sp. CC6]CAA7074406.1 Unannotated [Lentimonas sp. CC4]CAA7169016.1 Unannotated [Lentimonas sp. CC21]CAA7180577.1 Unannotated [Lentimonas sp. CC8]